MGAITLTETKGDVRVDSRTIAEALGNTHQHVRQTLAKFSDDFRRLGILPFETGEIRGRGQPERYALLNEDQCYLLLAFSRNTTKVRELKVALVRAFSEARARCRRTTVHDRLPMQHRILDVSADRGVTPSRIQRHVNCFAGVKRASAMTFGQLGESVDFCDRLRGRAETTDDVQRIEHNSTALYGASPQLALFSAAH